MTAQCTECGGDGYTMMNNGYTRDCTICHGVATVIEPEIGLVLSPAQTKVLWKAVYAALDSVDLPYEDTMNLRDAIDRQLCEQEFDLT